MARKTGARGLRSVMEKVLQRYMFTVPGSGTKTLSITAEMVREGLKPAGSPTENVESAPKKGRKKAS